MNRAWHARRAKAEIRRGGALDQMRHLPHLRFSHVVDLAWRQGVTFRLLLKDEP